MTEELKIYYKCRNCGFIVTDLQFRYAMFDYPCPICKKTHLSSFQIVKENETPND